MDSSKSLPTTDPPFRPLVIRSETESTPTSTPSSIVRTIDQRLGDFFARDRVEPFTDADLEQISFLLQSSGRHSYSRVPRIYSVLGIIDRLEFLDEFIKINATDLSFPFSATSLPSTIGVEIQSEFLRSQSLVLTKTFDSEKGEREGHLHSGKGEPIPSEVKGRLGTGSTGEVEKVISIANDYEAMMVKLLPVDPDLDTTEQKYQTSHIQNWKKLPYKVHLSSFECGGSPWRILFYPSGNNTNNVSLYLQCGDENGQEPENWYACAQFGIVLWSPSQPSKFASHVAHHRFNAAERDWGFTRFCDLKKLFEQSWDGHESPLVQNEEANITAYVRVVKDPTGILWHNFQNYDSKKETGMVGLRNQGATDYLNIILQCWYFVNALRKAVYQIPTKRNARTDMAWALQRLFYSLQTSDTPVSTQELTRSFGWDIRQSFEPQDVQEMSRKLMEKLEQRMKGTPVENAAPDLFAGKVKTYISCINVDYESSRTENFWDIQLNVANNRSLDAGFKEYIKVDKMEGDLQYYAGEQHKLQDARKGVIFERFPTVLNLHLKRYQYDSSRNAIVKVHNSFEFPEEFDASAYLSAGADKSEPWTYLLVGVIVHEGDIDKGFYYAFLRPTKHGPFYKFCDDRITRVTLKEAIQDNFGAKYTKEGIPAKKASAYMLVYIRKSRLDHVFADITKKDLPEHLEQEMAEDKAEEARRKEERETRHLYLDIGIISDETFRHHTGLDLTTADLAPSGLAAPKIYRILRTSKLGDFARQIANERKVKPEQIRLWEMLNRHNRTVRPNQPLLNYDSTFEEILAKSSFRKDKLLMFLEVAEEGKISWPERQGPNGSILLFLKHLDTSNQTTTGVGHVYVRKSDTVDALSPHIIKMMNWPVGTQFSFSEEVKPKMIEKVQSGKSFSLLEIGDGDIIRFQKVVTVTSYGVVVGAGADLALGDGYELGEAKRLLGSGG